MSLHAMTNKTPLNIVVAAVGVIGLFGLSGCETMNEGAAKGAGIGAITGAAIGGIVGHQDDRAVEGALIGAAAGATGGALIGSALESKRGEYLSVIKIAEMAEQGVPDDVIIAEIKRTRSRYQLTSETIAYLKEHKVSDRVIDFMLQQR